MRRRLRWTLTPLAALLLGALATGESRATVEEQRARLPPAADCEDSIQGIWRAHHFDARRGEWYVLSAEIRRTAPGASDLVGQIHSHFWLGTKSDAQPPPCGRSNHQASVRQPARGRVNGLKIEFGAKSWEPDSDPCPVEFGIGYNPDRLSGTVDPGRLEFQTLVNDGGNWVNEPVVFRRIQCLPSAAAPRPIVKVVPPPIFPTPSRGMCGKREGW